jgi:CheY-like chemotaxis protein
VTLKSNLNQGSRFSVAVRRAAAIGSASRAPAALRLEPGRLDGMVVLCIDNERAILDGIETLLSGWGCRVLKAADLAEAMAALAANRLEPDGMLVDYHLDSGNGIAAISQLRGHLGRPDGREIPAIVITADRSVRVSDEARAEGAHVLNKPIKPASLRALMMQWRVQRVAAE